MTKIGQSLALLRDNNGVYSLINNSAIFLDIIHLQLVPVTYLDPRIENLHEKWNCIASGVVAQVKGLI